MSDPSDPQETKQKIVTVYADIDTLQANQAVARVIEADAVRVYDLEAKTIESVQEWKTDDEFVFSGGITAPGSVTLGTRDETNPFKNTVKLKAPNVEVDTDDFKVDGKTTISVPEDFEGDVLTVKGGVKLEGTVVSDDIKDTEGRAYIRTSGTDGEVQLANLKVTTELEADTIVDTSGNEYIRPQGEEGEEEVDIDRLNVNVKLVSDDIQDTEGRAYIRTSGTDGQVSLANLDVTAELKADTIVDTSGNAYIRPQGEEGQERVAIERLDVTQEIVSDSIKDTEGKEYIKSSGEGGSVTLENLDVTDTINSTKVVSDNIVTTEGQSFLPLTNTVTATGREDPFTIPFAGDTFQNMIVDGNFAQFNGTMRGNAKYLTSFAERENQSLERRLSEFAKFSDRRIFVSATDGNDSNHGRSWDQAVKTIRRACEIAEPRTTIFVASGDYYEITPIFVKPNVAIIGDSLRNVFLYSKSWEFKKVDPNGKGEYAVPVNGVDYNRRDFFHLSTNTYLVGLRFKHLESPGYCAAFPAAMVDVDVQNGQLVQPVTAPSNLSPEYLPILYTPDGYFKDNLPLTGPYTDWEQDGEDRDVFFQVFLERIHIVAGGTGYSLDSRIDIAPPASEGGIRALALPEVIGEDGNLQRIRLFRTGKGYITEYRDLEKKDTLITLSQDGSGAVVRPVFRVDAFRAWFDEGQTRYPAGSVFSTIPSGVFESKRAYKSLLGTKDADELFPGEEPPSITLECGLVPRVSSFEDTARRNPGNFRKTSDFLSFNKRLVQNHVIRWVDQNQPSPPLTIEQRNLCERDIGLIVDAVVNDLFQGGMYESVRAANAYYSRANSQGGVFELIIPESQRQITANAIRQGRDYVLNTLFANWIPSQTDSEKGDRAKDVIRSLFDGIADTIGAGDTSPGDPEEIVENSKRYVAYKLHDSNLVKWRLEGRNDDDQEWDVLDERDFTFEAPDARNRTVTPNFAEVAKNNPGNFTVDVQLLYDQKELLQSAVIQHVKEEIRPNLNEAQMDLCRRDAGLIVLAIARDLLVGGYKNSARSGVAYYIGNRSVLPIDQTQPTIDAMVYLRDQIMNLVSTEAITIVEALVNGIIDTIVNPRISIDGRYGIQQPRGYHFYRLVMLQNDEERVDENGTMKVRRIEFFEEDLPEVVVDGPSNDLTIVDFVEMTERGSGYNPSNPPTVTFEPDAGDFPDETAEGVAIVSSDGSIQSILVTNAGRGYNRPPLVDIAEPPIPNGTRAEGFALMGADYAIVRVESLDPETGRIQKVRIVSPGSGYDEVPTVSIHAPERMRPFVTASPYVQNCSNISGPWDQQRKRVSEFHPLPYPINDIYRDGVGDVRSVNSLGSAGGIRIDGACPNRASPLRSFVVDAFTQVNQGGLGFLLINLAYAQFVSTFGTFCHTHMKALGGSFANASNSVTDFGILGLQARGFWPFPYSRARVVAPGSDPNAPTTWSTATGMYLQNASPPGYYSDVRSLSFVSRGSGFTNASDVQIRIGAPPSGTRARITGEPGQIDGFFQVDTSAFSESGQPMEDLVLQPIPNLVGDSFGQGGGRTFRGTGYKTEPQVEVSVEGSGEGLQLTAQLSGVSVIRVQLVEGRKPEILSIARIHGRWCTVESVREAADSQGNDIPGQYDITVSPPVNYAEKGFEILLHNVSYLSTGSHVMEYVGSGVTYNALPEYGGVPLVSAEISAIEPAKVFFTTSDHRGNSRVGPQFSVDQATGSIALEASQFDLSNINSIGPFVRNGVTVGERLREVSNNTRLRSDATGVTDGETVPTQVAVKTYVDRRSVPEVPSDFRSRQFFLQTDQFGTNVPGQNFVQRFKWKPLDASDLAIEQASLRTDVLTGLYVDGDARVYQTHTVGTLQITNPEEKPPLPNGALTIRVLPTESEGYELVFQMADPQGSGDLFETRTPMSRIVATETGDE